MNNPQISVALEGMSKSRQITVLSNAMVEVDIPMACMGDLRAVLIATGRLIRSVELHEAENDEAPAPKGGQE